MNLSSWPETTLYPTQRIIKGKKSSAPLVKSQNLENNLNTKLYKVAVLVNKTKDEACKVFNISIIKSNTKLIKSMKHSPETFIHLQN